MTQYFRKQRISLKQAVAQYGVNPSAMRRAISAGELEAVRPGARSLYVTPEGVEAWLASKTVRKGATAERAKEIIDSVHGNNNSRPAA